MLCVGVGLHSGTYQEDRLCMGLPVSTESGWDTQKVCLDSRMHVLVVFLNDEARSMAYSSGGGVCTVLRTDGTDSLRAPQLLV
jgi:hypothetical protein